MSRVSGVTRTVGALAAGQQKPSDVLGGLVGNLGLVGAAVAAVGKTATAVVDTVVGLPGRLKGLADSAANYVAALSPETANRYAMAWKDMTAVIGEALMPVVQTATRVVRFLADTVGGLSPIFQTLARDVIGAFTPAFAAAGDVFREFVTVGTLVYQIFKPFVGTLLNAVNPLQWLTTQMKNLAFWMNVVSDRVAKLLGIQLPQFDGSSQGKAFVSTGMTSPSAMLDQIRQRAFALGGPVKEDNQKKQVDLLGAILAKLNDVFNVDKIGKVIGMAVGDAVNDVGGKLVQAIDGRLKEMPNVIATAIKQAIAGVIPGGANVPAPILPNLLPAATNLLPRVQLPAAPPAAGFNLPAALDLVLRR